MLRASIEGRQGLLDGQVHDVRFSEFMADRKATVLRVFEFAGQAMTVELEAAINAHLRDNPRGRRGRVDYSLAQFGLEESGLRRQFSFYEERFGVSRERLPA